MSISTIILAFLIFFAFTAKSQVYVVVNDSVQTDSLNSEKIVEIYTLNKSNWDNGERITVIDIKGADDAKDYFYKCINLDANSVKKIRLKKLFTGAAKPPKAVNTKKELIDMVASTPGAVGYIDKEFLDKLQDNIKVVAVLNL